MIGLFNIWRRRREEEEKKKKKFPLSADELAELEGDAGQAGVFAVPGPKPQTPEEQAADPDRMRRERDHYRELYLKYGREHYYNFERVVGWRMVADSQDEVITAGLKHVEELLHLYDSREASETKVEAARAWYKYTKEQQEKMKQLKEKK